LQRACHRQAHTFIKPTSLFWQLGQPSCFMRRVCAWAEVITPNRRKSMNKAVHTLIIATLVSLAACWATASRAQHGPPGGLSVNVENTPLPVTGSLDVSGRAAGTRRVGDAGTRNECDHQQFRSEPCACSRRERCQPADRGIDHMRFAGSHDWLRPGYDLHGASRQTTGDRIRFAGWLHSTGTVGRAFGLYATQRRVYPTCCEHCAARGGARSGRHRVQHSQRIQHHRNRSTDSAVCQWRHAGTRGRGPK